MISVDGYTDIERIGRGGLGDVYRATRTSTGGVVAIKVLRDISDQSVAWHRTRRELAALLSLAGHANVIQLIEVLDLPGGPALVMEYAPGGSVAELLQRRDRPLSVGETALIGRQTAAALVAAHARGIVHRDVKPQNLLIDAFGQVKLCDFGIAAMARSDEFQDRTSAISMRYASPEDLNDEAVVGPASDVYSLGATMLHLARGAPPTLRERLAPWVPPSATSGELAALDLVIAACLHPTPAERPTAAGVVDDLERLGWSIDERNRALAFEPITSDIADDENPTAPRVVTDVVTDPQLAAFAGQRGIEPPADPTVHRTDRRPPSRPPPARRVRHPAIAVAVAIVTLAGLAAWLVAWWVGGRGGDVDRPTVEIVERPPGLTAITELDWPFGAVGECLVQVDAELASAPCGVPHDLQRIGRGELDRGRFPVGASFDIDGVHDAVRVECALAFESFVGVAVTESEFETPFTTPTAPSWAADDRGYQCMLGLDRRRLVGDASGSER
jgi:eukaryotic-like serine/threonine-protein kinase